MILGIWTGGLVLTGVPMHFTREDTVRFAPWPGLSKLETFSDVSKQVVNDAAILLRNTTSPNCKDTTQKSTGIRLKFGQLALLG